MKSKFFVIILALVLILTAAGCSSDKPDVEDETEGAVVQEEGLDSSLEGIDLLNSISGDRPKTMSMKMEISASGMTTTSTMYYDGDNTRTESIVPDFGTSVLIYNADEEVMYSYVEGTSEGIRIIGADMESAEEAGLTTDWTTEFSDLTEEIADSMIVRVEELEGEEVVYIETTEDDEEMGEITVKMWYSTVYNVPLRYEISMGQDSLMTMVVSDLQKDIAIDKNMFSAPSGINFQDIDMDAMM